MAHQNFQFSLQTTHQRTFLGQYSKRVLRRKWNYERLPSWTIWPFRLIKIWMHRQCTEWGNRKSCTPKPDWPVFRENRAATTMEMVLGHANLDDGTFVSSTQLIVFTYISSNGICLLRVEQWMGETLFEFKYARSMMGRDNNDPFRLSHHFLNRTILGKRIHWGANHVNIFFRFRFATMLWIDISTWAATTQKFQFHRFGQSIDGHALHTRIRWEKELGFSILNNLIKFIFVFKFSILRSSSGLNVFGVGCLADQMVIQIVIVLAKAALLIAPFHLQSQK